MEGTVSPGIAEAIWWSAYQGEPSWRRGRFMPVETSRGAGSGRALGSGNRAL